ncbi:MAG: hypothetical protein WDM92_16245 [Caulobacteraceae bacterium]
MGLERRSGRRNRRRRAARPGALSEEEARGLAAPGSLDDAPPPIRGDYPDWLDPHLQRVFGPRAADESAALSAARPWTCAPTP